MEPVMALKVFYSWQSDLPSSTNRNAIRQALRAAKKASSIDWKVDEATREMRGSGNTPMAILEKIRSADVFLADITPVNKGAGGRASPNPNVTFELGYAAAHLGWERIILLNNLAFGEIADAPFDFDRHRISTYQIEEGQTERQNKKDLEKLLQTGIERILKSEPLRPNDFSRVHAERARDGEMLRYLFECIHWPTVQNLWERGPHRRDFVGVSQFDEIEGRYFSPVFHIYDHKLKRRIDKFVRAYRLAVSHGECYHRAASPFVLIFTNPGDLPLSGPSEEKWQTILRGCERLARSQTKLLKYVRKNYPEIDINNTNSVAWKLVSEPFRTPSETDTESCS